MAIENWGSGALGALAGSLWVGTSTFRVCGGVRLVSGHPMICGVELVWKPGATAASGTYTSLETRVITVENPMRAVSWHFQTMGE